MKAVFRLCLITVLSLLLAFCGDVANAQTLDAAILETSFNEMPAYEEGGSIEAIEEAIYDIAREWSAGDLPVDVVKIGDLGDLNVTDLSLSQIAELTGLDLSDLTVDDLLFLAESTLEDLVETVPLLDQFTLDELDIVSEVSDLLDINLSGGETLGELIEGGYGDVLTTDVLGTVSVEGINLEGVTLGEFEGIEDSVISDVPGLGDIDLGDLSVEALDVAASFNFFPTHDISFGADEYSGLKPTPQPVSGGTNGNRGWEPIACSGGCAHIELNGPGWEGDNWMTRAHRVKDGYGFLGGIFGEAGAYRLPFGDAFALQIIGTNEAEGTAEWGIAFRYCQQTMFVDLGCTAYFMEVPLGITSREGELVIGGIKDGSGGSTQPLETPEEFTALEPPPPEEIASYITDTSIASNSFAVDEDCLSNLLNVVPTEQRTGAAENMPIILSVAESYGLDRVQIAYVLATVQHEVGPPPWNWYPVEEQGQPCSYDGGCDWHGRGYVQLTHKYNYEFVGEQIGVDLVSNPDLALEPNIAAQILIQGMMQGWFNGLGYGLAHYLREADQVFDWINARQTVNVLDKANTIAGYAIAFYEEILKCSPVIVYSGGDLGQCPLQTLRTGTIPAQEYGACRGNGCSRRHAGQDIDITQGVDDNFQAYIGGQVVYVGYNPGGYGHYVDIYNPDFNLVERIAEGAQLVVGLGDIVNPCQVVSIGESSTGVIHLEYREPVNAQNQGGYGFDGTIDPIAILEGLGIIRRDGIYLIPLNQN